MPKVSDEYLEARRDAILDAAEAVIARRGFEGATLTMIKEEADVSSGALYHYFKSKDAIVAAIRERYLALDIETYERALGAGSAKDALLDLVEAGIILNHGSPENRDARLAVMLWAEALVNDRIMQSQTVLMDEWWNTAHQLITTGIEQGEIAPDTDVEALSAILAALSLGTTVLEAWQPRRPSVDRLASTARKLLTESVWHGRAAE